MMMLFFRMSVQGNRDTDQDITIFVHSFPYFTFASSSYIPNDVKSISYAVKAAIFST